MAITATQREEITALFVGMFNAAPGATYLTLMVDAIDDGATLSQLASVLEARPEFGSVYPNFATAEEFAAELVANLLGSEVSAAASAWSTAWVVTQINSGMSRGQVILTAIQAIRATPNTNYTLAKEALANNVEVALYYSVTQEQSSNDLDELQDVLTGVSSDDATVVAAKAEIDADVAANTGQTFALTIGVDAVTGTTGNDIINALPAIGGTATTLTPFDSVNGGEGTDTINVLNIGALAGISASSTVTNVEIANITSDLGVTADVSTWTGLETVNVTSGGAVTLTTKGNATSVTVGGTAALSTVAITDSATVDTLSSVTISGNTGASTITSSALTSLSLASSNQDATVTAAAGTRALEVNVNALTAGILTDATATSVTVNASGAATSGVTLAAGAATAVTLDADVALTVAALTTAAATSLTIAGDSKVTVNAATLTALTSIDASASTGGADLDAFALAAGVTFTGGAGADSVQLGASTKATTMGAGNDTVILTGAALGTAGSVDAGEGTDTLSMIAANAATATLAATFEGTISGFERLVLTALVTDTVDLANLDDISYVSTAGATGVTDALTLNNLASGGTLVLTGSNTAATVVVKDAALVANTADVFNLTVSGAAGIAAGVVTVANVETVNIVSDDTAAAPLGVTPHTATLTAAAATALNVSGDAGLTLTLTGSTALTTINTSGVTKGPVSITTVADVATTFTGGATATTIDMSVLTATKAGTITTGAGIDNITGGAGADTITSGAGVDTIVAGAGNDTINAGDGADIITGGAGLDTITGGAGADKFVYLTAAESQGVTVDVITDFTAGTTGDVIDVSAVTGGAGAFAGVANGYGAVLTTLALGSVKAVLDSSTSTLYIDADASGTLDTADMAIQLTGVTSGLVAANFVF